MSEPAIRIDPPSATETGSTRSGVPAWSIAILLALVTTVLYWPAIHHEFLDYDDPEYVTENANVTGGLTLENLEAAFRNIVASNWHPVTMFSHMLDCHLFGLHPWGHHLTSVLLHALNTILVFILLRTLTGAMWRSAMVAALFGWHPLHVESVAWISERKDVLSAFFGLLSLIFYVGYARSKETGNGKRKTGNYLLALFCLALGLMCKPMLVTWPFVMLLLDNWPLKRMDLANTKFQLSKFGRLLQEKIPFFALAAAGSIIALWTQKSSGAVVEGELLPPDARVGNALISYCRYLGKLFWPDNLVYYYPHPGHWPLAQVLLAAVLLGGVSGLFYFQRQSRPFLLVVWLWFLGTLVPVIGLVQAGEQSMADRYTYIPSLGIFILAVWGISELTQRWRLRAMVGILAGGTVIIICLGVTRQQIRYWKDSETLFRHAVEVNENNYVAHNNLGLVLAKQGQTDEAILQLQTAIRFQPNSAGFHNSLALILGDNGQTDEAIRAFQTAIRLKPDSAGFHNNLGIALEKNGRTDEAVRQYQEAIRLEPDFATAYNNLGFLMAKHGENLDQARVMIERAVQSEPKNAAFLDSLGWVLFKSNRPREALDTLLRAIAISAKQDASLYEHLGDVYAALNQREKAAEAWRQSLAVESNPQIQKKLDNLSAP